MPGSAAFISWLACEAGYSTAQFGKTIASDIDRYSAVAQQLGLRVD